MRRALERRLESLEGFSEPRLELEQYVTPADIAAHLIHLADLRGDLNSPVIDLGTGTGVLAIGAASRGATPVIGLDSDPAALAVARTNAEQLDRTSVSSWLLGDARQAPLCSVEATILMNPPFGAQEASEGDRGFLETAARIGRVSYSIHNSDSGEFIEAFVDDRAGQITDRFAIELDLTRQFEFHQRQRKTISAEAYRIEWPSPESGSVE